MTNEALAEFIGRRVKVWQGGSESYYYTEEGVLTAYDHPWICLRSDGGPLCIPVYSIRLMRLAPEAAEMPVVESLLEAA